MTTTSELLKEAKDIYDIILQLEQERAPSRMERTMYLSIITDTEIPEARLRRALDNFWTLYFEEYVEIVSILSEDLEKKTTDLSETEKEVVRSLRKIQETEMWTKLIETSGIKLTQRVPPVSLHLLKSRFGKFDDED